MCRTQRSPGNHRDEKTTDHGVAGRRRLRRVHYSENSSRWVAGLRVAGLSECEQRRGQELIWCMLRYPRFRRRGTVAADGDKTRGEVVGRRGAMLSGGACMLFEGLI